MSDKKPKGEPPELPPNFYDFDRKKIDPEKTRGTVDAWYRDALARRSVPVDRSAEPAVKEEAEESLFLAAAEKLARSRGTSAEAILAQYAQRLKESIYPTPECLTPDEVLAYSGSGTFDEARKAHTEGCAACRSLLAATPVSERLVEDFLEEVRRQAAPQKPIPIPAPSWVAGPPMTPAPAYVSAAARPVWLRVAVAATATVPVLALAVWLSLRTPSEPGTLAPIRSVTVLARASQAKAAPSHRTVAAALELNSNLGTLRSWNRVVTPSSPSIAFAAVEGPSSEIARGLKVDGVFFLSETGTKPGANFSLSLYRASTAKEDLIGEFSGAADQFFGTVNRMALSAASSADVHLTEEEIARLNRPVPANPRALEFYSWGLYHLSKRSDHEIKEAIRNFESAIREDARFAPAYVGLADCYNLSALGYSALYRRKDAYQQARRAARRALELDPSLAGAHATVGLSKLWYEWDWQGAEDEFKKALQLNPNQSQTHHWYGLFLALMGRTEEATRMLSRAIELGPKPPLAVIGALGDGFYMARRYDLAIQQYTQALQVDGKYEGALLNRASAYVRVGRYHEAISTFQQFGEDAKPSLAHAYAASGDKEAARKLLAELTAKPAAGKYSPFGIAEVYAALGDRERAFHWLEKAYEQHHPELLQIKVSPDLDSLRSDSRYRDLLRRMNFPK